MRRPYRMVAIKCVDSNDFFLLNLFLEETKITQIIPINVNVLTTNNTAQNPIVSNPFINFHCLFLQLFYDDIMLRSIYLTKETWEALELKSDTEIVKWCLRQFPTPHMFNSSKYIDELVYYIMNNGYCCVYNETLFNIHKESIDKLMRSLGVDRRENE